MSELFEVPEVLSPKLAWLKKHRLKTTDTKVQWCCSDFGEVWFAFGATEDEAIIFFCEKHNLKHYSLEG